MSIKLKIPEPEKIRVRGEHNAIESQRIETLYGQEVVVTRFKYRVGIWGGKRLNQMEGSTQVKRRWVEEDK